MDSSPARRSELRSPAVLVAAGVLLAAHTAVLVWGLSVHSPGFDEVGHLAAGISHWRTGDFTLYRVNPPLVRMVATLPLVLRGARVDGPRYWSDPLMRAEFLLGDAYIEARGAEAIGDFALARLACLPFSLLGGLVCFRWAGDLHGARAGLVALALWCGSPHVIANAQMITPDVGAAALGTLACYTFWRWLRSPGTGAACLAGACLGLALLAKFTWLILPAVWTASWLVFRRRTGPPRDRPRARDLLELAILGFVALQVVGLGYAFDGVGTPLGAIRFHSRSLRPDRPDLANRLTGTPWGHIPSPVPVAFLEGIDVQKQEFEKGYWSYLRGEWRFGGWWYYYLYAWIVKEPIGLWGLVALAAWPRRAFGRRGPPLRDELAVLLPALVLMALVSAQTGFNHHLRYILPAFPFVFIWASRVFRPASGSTGHRWREAAATACLACLLIASARATPHHLAYFNELAGGTGAGHHHLLNSNVDWGQDLLFLKDWADRHPGARPLQVVYRGGFRSESLKVWDARTEHRARADLGPRAGGTPPRWLGISLAELFDRQPSDDPYRVLRSRTPDAIAGTSIYLYRLDGVGD